MGNEEKGKTRISPEDYWRLRDLGKQVNKERETYQKWLRKRARKEKCYIDQIENTMTGKVRMDPTPECPEGEVKRLGDVFIAEAEPKFEKLEKVVREFNDMCEEVARAYSTRVDLLDPKTGKISPDDSVEAAKKDLATPKKKTAKKRK